MRKAKAVEAVKTKAKPKPKPAKKVGKPTTYTAERANAVIDLLERGIWVTEACRLVGIPHSTWCDWVEADREGLSVRSARARNRCYDVIAADTIQIADDMPLTNPISGALDSASVQHNRLRIDTRFRLLSKVCPERYGDKVAVEHSGKVGLEQLVTGEA